MKKKEILIIVEKAMCQLFPVSGDIEYCGYIDGKDDFYKELKETLSSETISIVSECFGHLYATTVDTSEYSSEIEGIEDFFKELEELLVE